VKAYMSFALCQARRNMGRRTVEARMKCGMSEDDAISAANLGLMNAIRRFDPANGARFTTYAGWWIKKALSLARYDAHAIKVPFNDRKKYSKYSKLVREGKRVEEIAQMEGVKVAEVQRILDLTTGRQDSYDAVMNDLDHSAFDFAWAGEVGDSVNNAGSPATAREARFGSLVQDVNLVDDSAESMQTEELYAKLEAAKMRLGSEELLILHDRFSRGISVSEIARSRGISPETAKNRIQTILSTLKIHLSD
jgi:RNA polymerase sigma factor (sigma-70 family)